MIARVVDKFILQLEAQLSDRNVTIELTDEARAWLVKNGYDEAMGARPMARVIQTQIKTPLADEVLFGRLKNGGVVKVVVTGDETGEKKLGFVYPEGPAQPRMERDLIVAAKARGRSRKRVEPAAPERLPTRRPSLSPKRHSGGVRRRCGAEATFATEEKPEAGLRPGSGVVLCTASAATAPVGRACRAQQKKGRRWAFPSCSDRVRIVAIRTCS